MGLFSWIFGSKDKAEKPIDKKNEDQVQVGETTDHSDCEERLKQKDRELSSVRNELNQTKLLVEKLQSGTKDNKSTDADGKIVSLEKTVKDLKEEIEDYEDEVKNLKKKVSERDEKNKNLDKELLEARSESKRLKEENQENQVKLKQAESERNQLQDSGEFISALLKAKLVDGASKDVEKAVYAIQRFVKQELNPFYHKHYNLSEYEIKLVGAKSADSGFELLDTWAAQTCKTWLNNKKVISFIGEFSAGKTTIVNTILKSGNANATELPTCSKATTAIPTYISDGKLSKYTFVSDGVRKEIDKERFEKTSKETLGKIEGISSLITYFVMEYSNPNLSGLSILDTPGFDSNDADDAKRTLEVVNESDALFWVVDVNKGELNKNSINVIRNGLSKPLYIVINQCDGKAPAEIEATKKKIEQTVLNSKLQVKGYITYGKGMPLENIMSEIKKLPKSNTNNYVYDLRSMVQNDISVYETVVKEGKQSLKECEDSIDNGESVFNDNLEYLCRHADNAAAQPHWETHIFSSDRYEMSSSEYSEMCDSLNECKECCNTLRQNLEVYGKQVQYKTQVMNNLAENKQIDSEMRSMFATLDKLIKDLEMVQK